MPSALGEEPTPETLVPKDEEPEPTLDPLFVYGVKPEVSGGIHFSNDNTSLLYPSGCGIAIYDSKVCTVKIGIKIMCLSEFTYVYKNVRNERSIPNSVVPNVLLINGAMKE